MKKVVLTFGLISGILCSVMMLITLPFEDRIGFDRGLIVGYTTIVASFLLVYFGIRSYRNNVGGGQITFGKAFLVGISITMITCIFYVVTWQVMYFYFMPDFMTNYGAHAVEKLRASGASEAAIQAKLLEVQKNKAIEDNPLTNAAMTFLEPFPVGLLITLISAAVLRKRVAGGSAQGAVAEAS
jgi:Protein of unknown function (DUF4199)